MPKRTFTAAAIERIKPPKQGQTDHFDQGFPGLALRVSYGGAKTWVYFYRRHRKQHRMTLGRLPAMGLAAAREAWRQARESLDKGENPARQKPAVGDSFSAVAAEWLKRDQAHNRSQAEVQRVIERDVNPAWEGRQIGTIGRRDVIELIDGIADRGAVTMARRTHAHLHRLFRWCVGRGIIATNPMTDLPKPGATVKRDRVLTDAELAITWRATEKIAWPFGPAFRLLLLTGCRREEVAALRWSEIGTDCIELSGNRTKTGEPRTIPLSCAAAAVISSLPRMSGSEFVFTTTGRTSVSGWSRAKTLLDRAVAEINGNPLPSWRLHDLRRSIATGLQRLGIGLQTIEAVLGHVAGSRAGIVGVYQRHSFAGETRVALEAWARHIEALTSDKPDSNVVSLRASGA